MKLKILDLNGNENGEISLPEYFNETIREDLIWRAFITERANMRQKYGAYPRAGIDYSAKISRRRQDYKGSYGHGISRVPRKVLIKRGNRMYWVGAVSPETVGGRRAHPPKSEKIFDRKINTKEKRKALRSAILASLNKELSSKRGHFVPKNYPFAITDDFENIKKTKEVVAFLEKLGFKKELQRGKIKKIRAGKGKMRARPYKKKKSLLLVVSKNCPLIKSSRNIPGIDVSVVNYLNVNLLSPGGIPGRVTLFTKSAIEKIKEKNLFA